MNASNIIPTIRQTQPATGTLQRGITEIAFYKQRVLDLQESEKRIVAERDELAEACRLLSLKINEQTNQVLTEVKDDMEACLALVRGREIRKLLTEMAFATRDGRLSDAMAITQQAMEVINMDQDPIKLQHAAKQILKEAGYAIEEPVERPERPGRPKQCDQNERFKEHDLVELIHDAMDESGLTIVGSATGTIVHVYNEVGLSYDVEFPSGGIITVFPHQIRRAKPL